MAGIGFSLSVSWITWAARNIEPDIPLLTFLKLLWANKLGRFLWLKMYEKCKVKISNFSIFGIISKILYSAVLSCGSEVLQRLTKVWIHCVRSMIPAWCLWGISSGKRVCGQGWPFHNSFEPSCGTSCSHWTYFEFQEVCDYLRLNAPQSLF